MASGCTGKMTLESALLLLLALSATETLAQGPPNVTRYIGDSLVQVNISTDSSKSLNCPNREGSFIGVANREGNNYVSSTPTFAVDLSYTRGDLTDLQRMRRERLGAYHCLYLEGGNVNAYSLILTEKPRPEQIPNSDIKRVGTGHGEDLFEPYCRIPAADSSDLVWELYRDNSGLFERYSTGRMLSLTYTALSREHGNGMTIYRCYNRRNPEKIQYNWAMYSENLQIRPVRASNYENTPLQYNVRYQAPITLECHGNGSTTAIKHPTWMFKRDGSEVYTQLADASPALEIKYLTTLSTLTIQRMTPQYSGYYKCDKDDINHAVKISVNYGEVIIKEYSKSSYPLTQNNYIVCELPEKSMKEQATFTLYRTGLPPLTITGSTSVEGFTTSFDSQGNLAISFTKRSDMEDCRLVCKFFGSSDYTTIKTVLPKLTLSIERSGASFEILSCERDRSFREQPKVYVLSNNGSLWWPIKSLPSSSSSVNSFRFYQTRTPEIRNFVQYICTATYDGQELRSNIVSNGSPDVSVDLYVEGEKSPPRRVFLSGRDVTLECHFNGIPFNRDVQPAGVSIFKNDERISLSQEIVSPTVFRYVLRNAGPSDNGNYRCNYNFAAFYRTSVSITGSFSSSTSNLQFCTGAQFVCDQTCKDASLMCDKKADCSDGADEAPENCDKCEPNEVKCETHNGQSPTKRCVLKHWLCDGQDDCGNGYDENLSLHSKFCFKENTCTRCRPEETCCPRSSDKCIQRNYECDKENDCDGGTDELMCDPTQCLRLLEPTTRLVLRKRVGDSISMTCIARGMDRPTINWRRNWASLPRNGVEESNEVTEREPVGRYTVLGTLQFVSLTKNMSGIYNCEAVNNCKRELSYEIDLRVSD
ncbi:hypothetical protein BOX15_Mlig010706g2 [Macrostomum lignano]|uniref:Ig-like domain-containing protein n=1 Tax=Macrostomum lignano TaxID=282301 RepID=A0A267F643_9PLAT|nr:hypothetical protein BOX15_Mlig010706g2 [Macrostomum lignano]